MTGEGLTGRLAWVRGDVRIEQAERLDDFASIITEQWIVNAMRRGKRVKDRRRVGSDRDDADSGGPRFAQCVVQLDQLIATVRSPIGRPGEDHQQTMLAHEFIARSHNPRLIGQRKVLSLIHI